MIAASDAKGAAIAAANTAVRNAANGTQEQKSAAQRQLDAANAMPN